MTDTTTTIGRRVDGVDGIACLCVPTPFAIGTINAFLIEDEPLTLVDSGPNWGVSLQAIEHGLAELGHRVEELELLLVTHQHNDHLGLTQLLADRAGAEIACLDLLAPYARDFHAAVARDDDLAAALMTRHGVPPDVVAVLRAVTTVNSAWGGAFQADRVLRDGEEVALRDRRLRVHHRPGHSPSDTLFVDEADRVMLGGDHLLSRISSNALLARPLPDDGGAMVERPHALDDYLASLRRTREDDLRLVLGGHGPPVDDHRALIDERLGHHEQRLRRILRLMGAEPTTAFALCRAMWGSRAITQAYLTISEAVGHLDVLADRGWVTEDEDGDLRVFRATEAGLGAVAAA